MQQSEQINELASALAKAQGLIKTAAMDGFNPFFKSRYATLGSVWDACRKALQECSLSVTQFPVSTADGAGVTTTLLHSSGQWMRETLILPLPKDDAQGSGSAIRYARRYALAAVLGIVDEDDDDGNAASGKHRPEQKPAQEPAKQASQKPASKPADSAKSQIPPPSDWEQIVNIGQGLIKHHVAKEGELLKEIREKLSLSEKVKIPELPPAERKKCVEVATTFCRDRMAELIESELTRTGRTLEKAIVFLGHEADYPANKLTPEELFKLATKLAAIKTEEAA